MKKIRKIVNKHFKKSTGKLNKEVTNVINNDIEDALKRADLLLADNKVSEPIIIKTADTTHENVRFRLTKRERHEFDVEFDHTLLTVLYFGANDLTYYQTSINHVTGHVFEDVLGVVKYKDIVNNEFMITNDYDEKLDTTISKLNVLLSLKDGDTINLTLRNHHEYNEDKYPNLLTTDEKYVIDTLKRAIN